jgi:hypothetical protein
MIADLLAVYLLGLLLDPEDGGNTSVGSTLLHGVRTQKIILSDKQIIYKIESFVK